jgi:predicted RNA-binding Zn-ribbon protein involved in translation (DUF1610 family)
MDAHVSFRCPACGARLRASVCFLGHTCPCPKCGREIIVRFPSIEEQAPILVFDEEYFSSQGAAR